MISVSHKYKAIFWHIHKTGGTFIEQILTNYYDFVDSNIIEVNLEELDKKFKQDKDKDKDKDKEKFKEKEDKEKKYNENIENIQKNGLFGKIIKNGKHPSSCRAS